MPAGGSSMRCSAPAVAVEPDAGILEQLFRALFFSRWRTLLVGGGDEPVYLPARDATDVHRIIYREDFFASALHEVAHWCIAGEARRQQLDYGYWYQPDGRSAEQQRVFERVEVKPQALEWLFATAAGQPFRISADNLHGDAGCSAEFAAAVQTQARNYCRGAMPLRARLFARGLGQYFALDHYLEANSYCLAALGFNLPVQSKDTTP